MTANPPSADVQDMPAVPMASSASDAAPQPYVPPPPEGPRKKVLTLRLSDPFRWLHSGWRDLTAHMGIGIFYGMCFWAMGLTLAAVFRAKPEYVMSIASGCLLLGPFLAMGLYEVSRRRELGQTPRLSSSLTCWDAHLRSVGMLVLVLIVLELLWGRASLVVFAVFFNTGMPSTTGVLDAVFNPQNWEFVAVYLVVGAVFASIVYAMAVVSIPMILDRDTDAISAAISSIQVVYENTGVMVLWGLILCTIVAFWRVRPLAGALLIPYLGWVTFAATLNFTLWRANPTLLG